VPDPKKGLPFSDGRIESIRHLLCAVVVGSSWHEPVACAFERGHDGDHSWATLPQFDPAAVVREYLESSAPSDWGPCPPTKEARLALDVLADRCPLCGHEWCRHDPDDGCCDMASAEGIGVCKCGRDLAWMNGKVADLSRAALSDSKEAENG